MFARGAGGGDVIAGWLAGSQSWPLSARDMAMDDAAVRLMLVCEWALGGRVDVAEGLMGFGGESAAAVAGLVRCEELGHTLMVLAANCWLVQIGPSKVVCMPGKLLLAMSSCSLLNQVHWPNIFTNRSYNQTMMHAMQ